MSSPLSKSARLVAFFAIVLSLMIILASLMSCNPLKHYKDVLKDSVNRSAEAKALLAIPCSQEYPVLPIKIIHKHDTEYVANPLILSQCAAIYDSLNTIAKQFNELKLKLNSKDTLNTDSVMKVLARRFKMLIIYDTTIIYKKDSASIKVANLDRDKAIMMAANADKLTCEANTKVKQFEQDKQSTWQCFKWFCASLPYWIWIILTLIFGGSIVIKLLKSGILKFV